MKSIIGLIAIMAISLSTQAQSEWAIDNSHSSIKFGVTHMSISEVDGEFKKFSGKILSKSDDFTDAQIDFTIDVNSITTDDEKRDGHLKGDDFFNAEKYPNITFKGTSFKKVSGNKYSLEGNLTMRDVTKSVKFDVTYNGTIKDQRGNLKAGFKATTVINRLDYNLKWNSMFDAGPVVGKDVTITVNVELKKM